MHVYNLYEKQGVRKTQRMGVTSGEKVDGVKEEGQKRKIYGHWIYTGTVLILPLSLIGCGGINFI